VESSNLPCSDRSRRHSDQHRCSDAVALGSVESSHSSWMRVAAHLERPTRELVWAHSALPYSVLLRVGFTVPQSVATCAVRSYRTFSPLPHIAVRRFVFCGTFRRLAPPSSARLLIRAAGVSGDGVAARNGLLPHTYLGRPTNSMHVRH
jgi:hypothetical protein